MRVFCLWLIAPIIVFAAEDPYAAQLFQKNCASCHANAAAGGAARIPQLAALKTLTPKAILKTLETGVMKPQAAALSTNEREALANFLGTAVTAERKREEIANPCPANAGWKNGPGWSGWGAGLANMRFQPAGDAGLKAEDVPRLAPKWVFAFPDASVLRSQPAVYRGRVFVGSPDGSVYSLDAVTGCVHWITTVEAEVRSGMTVAESAGAPVLFFGDSSGNYYALDAATGNRFGSCVRRSILRPRAPERPRSTKGGCIWGCRRSRKGWRFRPITCAARSAGACRPWTPRLERCCGSDT